MDPKVIVAVKPLFMRVNQGINHTLAACEGFKVMINLFWAHERNCVFWEKDVSNMSDGVFISVFWMERAAFDKLVQALPEMAKKDTNFRNCIPLQKRVAIAAFAMGSASEYFAIAWMFGVSTPNVLRDSEGVLPPGVAEFGTHLFRTRFSNAGESGRSALANYFCAQELE